MLIRRCFYWLPLWSPIRQYMDYKIRVLRIIRFDVHCVIMLSIHARMHHEDTGLNYGAFTGFEYHRTDG